MLITADHAGWSQPTLKERAVPSLITKGTAGSATQDLLLNLAGNDLHDQEMPTDKDEKGEYGLKVFWFFYPIGLCCCKET